MDISNYIFIDGVIFNNNTFVFIGLDDKKSKNQIKHGIVFKFKDGIWNHVEIAEPLTSCTSTEIPEYRFIAIAETGREFIIGENEIRQEIIKTETLSPTSYGPLTSIKCWQGTEIYAVGMARQIYKKSTISKWKSYDLPCVSATAEQRAFSGLLSVDGYNNTEAYAVGIDGEIWSYNGEKWHLNNSPTNFMLHDVCCAKNGTVYICGQNGLIVSGRHENWKIIEQDITYEDLRAISDFDNEIYICSSNLIYKLVGNELIQVDIEVPFTTTGKIKASNDVLLSIGLKDILLYHKNSWKNITL